MKEFINELEALRDLDLVLGKTLIINDTLSLIPIHSAKVSYTNLDTKANVLGIRGGLSLSPLAIIEVRNNRIQIHTLKEGMADFAHISGDVLDIVSSILDKNK